jgi:hypothetical protein
MKKIIAIITLLALMCTLFTGCSESWKREMVDFKSEYGGGLDRTVTVYTADGKVIAEYKGKIDIESHESYVKFDFEGKRYIYYNCFVETIADI